MSKNIFYVSNTQPELFPQNSRTKFDQYIDINELDYIKYNDLEVAVKSISFDTRQYVDIGLDIQQPHFMIIQTLDEEMSDTFKNFMESKGLVGQEKYGTSEHKSIEDLIDITQTKDFILCNTYYSEKGSTEINFIIEQRYNRRNFSNIIFIDGNKIFHHIYMHNTQFYFLDSFLKNFNQVMKDLVFYHNKVQPPKSFIINKKILLPFQLPMLIRHDIGIMLGLYTEKKSASRLLHYFQDDLYGGIRKSFPGKQFPANFFIRDVYLPEQDLIYFDLKKHKSSIKIVPLLFQTAIYEIRSNISEWTIHNAKYDKLVGVFQDKRKKDVLSVEFQNPIFFKTRKESLSNAKFDIEALFPNGSPKFAIGSPTYIQLIVREAPIEMKRPFNIFLDSSCSISKELYPQNTNTDFTIELPERLKFRLNWTVSLKTLFLSNKIHNIEDCTIIYQYITDEYDIAVSKTFTIENGHYNTLDQILKMIQQGFRENQMPFLIKEVNNGRVKISHTKRISKGYKVNFIMSKYLASILGYTSSPRDMQFLRFDQNNAFIAPHKPNLFLTYPRNLIIGCHLVQSTIFGGEPFQLLRLVTNSDNLDSDVLSFEFLQDEKVPLKVREFKSIHISILDATGSPVKSESNFPTRLQLMFSLE